jgi:CRISPR-associated protein Csx14
VIRYPHPDITLDVDLRNPGQFFACCGVLELASRLWLGSEGWFARNGSRASFQVATGGGLNDPLGEIVRRICEPEDLVSIPQDEYVQALQADRQPVLVLPFGSLKLDWWLVSERGGDKSELKVWAGQQTPERNINSLRNAWRQILGEAPEDEASRSLFQRRWPMTGRFGFDPAAAWEALDVGFSPDEQGVPVQTSPATEILAAIGLQRCRPVMTEKRGRWFTYRPWCAPIEIAVAPAAISGAGPSTGAYEFPVLMRNAQYGSFGWAKPLED